MSLVEENSSVEKLVVQNITKVSLLDGATVIRVQVSENSDIVSETPIDRTSDKDGTTKIVDCVNDSKELDGRLKQVESIPTSVSKSVNDTELNVSQSSGEKNRRKKKKKDSDIVTKDGTEVQNIQSSNTDPDSDEPFRVQHLNEVFSVWGITKCKEDGESENSVDSAVILTKYKQIDDDIMVEISTAETSEQSSKINEENVQFMKQVLTHKQQHKQVKDDGKLEMSTAGTSGQSIKINEKNVQFMKQVLTHKQQHKQMKEVGKLEMSTAGTSGQSNKINEEMVMKDALIRMQQIFESHCLAGTGKSKSADKRRKMKNLAGQGSDKSAETVSKQYVRNAVMLSSDNCHRYVSPMEHVSSTTEGSNMQAVSSASQDLTKSEDELYRLLKLGALNNLSSKKHRNAVELPGRSSPNEHLQTIRQEVENDSKSDREVPHEHGKLEKTLKKKTKKTEVLSEGQSKNKKKKEKSKNKRGTTTPAASRDVSDLPETSTSTPQKSPERKQKKKNQQFEEYWALDAVKEALQKGTVIEGPIRINPRRYTEAYVASPTGGQDILIEGITDRNRALEGDLVAIQLKDPSQWKVKNQKQEKKNCKIDTDTLELIEEESAAIILDLSGVECDKSQKPQVTAKVIAILSMQHTRKCVGYLKVMKKPNEKNALFSPRDARVPRMQIPQFKCPKDFWLDPASKENTLYLGKMIKWTSGTFALGEIVKEIGETADVRVETEALLIDNDLDVSPYPEAICKLFSSFTLNVNEEELKKREDLRKECIFTIDPQSAKDLDDAVSCKELANGNLEIGVHISDVTSFLEEGSVLDNEVSKRATSVYLVDAVHHMLPVELCLICSLLPQEDKFAYSVIWEVSKNDANIISQRITRSIIKSCVKLSYDHAQAMIENPDKEMDPNDFPAIGNGFSLADISKAVNNLQAVAKKLRSQRFGNGALRIDQTKLFLQLDSSGMPVAVHEYVNKESHRLIEELALLANMTVAKCIYDKYPDVAFLRSHPEPHRWPLEQLQNAMASRGIHLDITTAGDLQTSLVKYSGSDYLSQIRHMVLNSLCAKTMTRAKYFCSGGVQKEEFWHYALSVPFYTHFTSPIRRYSDVMVHRLLNATLNYCSKPEWSEDYVSGIAANCNKKKHSAKTAGEQSIKLYLAIYLRNNQPAIEDAVVIDVKDYSFDVIVIKYGLPMRVYLSKLNVNIANDPGQKTSPMKIIWNHDEHHPLTAFQVVDVFTLVKVLIRCDDLLKLEAVLIRPEISDRLPSET